MRKRISLLFLALSFVCLICTLVIAAKQGSALDFAIVSAKISPGMEAGDRKGDEDGIPQNMSTGYGDPDPDGTPRDIGAYSTCDHAYWEYAFENQADYERWHWVSYPVLNTITDNALQASVFFEELLHVHQKIVNGLPVDQPTYLDRIDWMVEGDLESIAWYNEDWTSTQFTHYVSSPQGYKIKLLQGVPDTV
ncbi:MAG: hypothetical protein WC944_11315, partial [Candidatus Cloacimonadaceae bacterium]